MAPPLVEEMAFGLSVYGSYKITNYLSAGIFLLHERGLRESARYLGVNNGSAEVSDGQGGSFHETWAGPFVRGQYKWVFFDIGYGAFGSRKDDGRTDIPDQNGGTSESFKVSSFAWIFSLGSQLEITNGLTLVLRIQYRIRYYDSRGSTPLMDNIIHGTQDITPYVGVLF